jgi:3-keto-disaccharide hydrolase
MTAALRRRFTMSAVTVAIGVTLVCRVGALPLRSLASSVSSVSFRPLFDGKTTADWRGFRQAQMPEGWRVIDGALTRTGAGGDIVSVEEFGDFELSLEWKLGANGNSGVFFRVTEDDPVMWHTAPELQLIDNGYSKEPLKPAQSAGARCHEAARNVERNASAGEGQPRRALDERREGGRVRTVERRLGTARPSEQVQGLSPLRAGAARPYRPAGPWRPGRLPEYENPESMITREDAEDTESASVVEIQSSKSTRCLSYPASTSSS